MFFSALMLGITWPYFSFRYDVSFLLTKQNELHIWPWRLSFYVHISSSLLVLFSGFFQFPAQLRRNYPTAHRNFGKIYVLVILLLSAPSGFVMALYANGGWAARLSFGIISCLWWWFTCAAFVQARRANWPQHRAFMYRSFALTLSAITLRSYVLLLPHVVHLNGKQLYVLVAWLSWVPNLLVAEWLIRRRQTAAATS